MDLKNPPISGELKLQITRLIEAPINLEITPTTSEDGSSIDLSVNPDGYEVVQLDVEPDDFYIGQSFKVRNSNIS